MRQQIVAIIMKKKALLREIVLFMRFFLMVGIALLFLIADGIVVLFL